MKEELALWVSRALRQALSTENISQGFLSKGIFPFNPHAMDSKMSPSSAYDIGDGQGEPAEVQEQD